MTVRRKVLTPEEVEEFWLDHAAQHFTHLCEMHGCTEEEAMASAVETVTDRTKLPPLDVPGLLRARLPR